MIQIHSLAQGISTSFPSSQSTSSSESVFQARCDKPISYLFHTLYFCLTNNYKYIYISNQHNIAHKDTHIISNSFLSYFHSLSFIFAIYIIVHVDVHRFVNPNQKYRFGFQLQNRLTLCLLLNCIHSSNSYYTYRIIKHNYNTRRD